ncbi:MAG: class sortase [Candidatus Saccharibacteria bacterium]|nr:class sortase [Candidatus Saccharibacteria bacterium]
MVRFAAIFLLSGALAVTASQATASRAAAAVRDCPYAAPPYPEGPKPAMFGTLTIDSIGLRTPIFRGSWPDMSTEASKSLMYGPALYSQTQMGWPNSWPGQGGTVGIAGHRTTRTHPFCLAAQIGNGVLARIKTSYGTFVYRAIANFVLPGNDDAAFKHPARYDPHPKLWTRGVKPEYLVLGACDPPHSALRRINVILKLVGEYA